MTKLGVKFVLVKLLCVCVNVWRREAEAEAGKRPGIQNQKQEPHTKLWGIMETPCLWDKISKSFAEAM